MSVESKVRELLAKGKELDALINEEVQELDEAVCLRTLNATGGDSSILHKVSSNANPEIQDLSGTGDKHGGLTSNIGQAAS